MYVFDPVKYLLHKIHFLHANKRLSHADRAIFGFLSVAAAGGGGVCGAGGAAVCVLCVQEEGRKIFRLSTS